MIVGDRHGTRQARRPVAITDDPQTATSNSKLAGAYNARGLDYKSTEDMDAAVKDFKAALRLFPDNADYQANYNSVKAWDQ